MPCHAPLITFAPRRWPALPGDVTDPDVVDQLHDCACVATVCMCHDASNRAGITTVYTVCRVTSVQKYVPDPPAAWERRVRPRSRQATPHHPPFYPTRVFSHPSHIGAA